MPVINLGGHELLVRKSDELYDSLANVAELVKTMPDVKTVKSASEEAAEIVVKPGFSFASGELATTVTRVEATPKRAARFVVASKGIGASSKVQVQFQLESADDKTVLHWQAEVQELGGLLKLVPSGLIKGAAQKVIEGWLKGLTV